MDRAEAWELLNSKVKEDYLIKHSLASEAIMRALAKKLGHDEDLWGIAGLLHDLDFEETKEEPKRHALVAAPVSGGQTAGGGGAGHQTPQRRDAGNNQRDCL